MTEKTDVRLTWEGRTTLNALYGLVEARVNFEVQLPPDYHFALYRHLFPNAAPTDAEIIDVSGAPEMLEKVAEIRGLQELGELTGALTDSAARVRIQSPGPGIMVYFGDARH